MLQYANSTSLGGRSDWVAGTPTSILGMDLSAGLIPALSAGDILYDIFSIDGGDLYVGAGDGVNKTVGERPTTLSTVPLSGL